MANPLDIIRMLASQVKRVNPSQMSRPEVAMWRELSRKQYLPEQRKAWELEQKLRDRAANTWNDARQAEHLTAADDAAYIADRYGKMSAASDMIAGAAPMRGMGGESVNPMLRASYLPGDKAPGGVITYQAPQHMPEDPLIDAATYVELLGASPKVKGAGRVLLRDAGLTSPSNPLTLHSVSDPRTMDFYESRGMDLIPRQLQERSSGLSSTLPAYRIDRGDMLKEAKGGLVQAFGGGGKVAKQVIDPLAQWVATRMTGQLEQAGKLSGLGHLNIPAAYAGDQRSLQAVQRAIRAKETGLESPGRRKILKQGAATAARSMVPDALVEGLGTNILKNSLQDAIVQPVIPKESIQAAIAAKFRQLVESQAAYNVGDMDSTELLTAVQNGLTFKQAKKDFPGLVEEIGKSDYDHFAKTYMGLSPESIAREYQLPVDQIKLHIERSGLTPQDAAMEWIGTRSDFDAYIDSTGKHQFRDYFGSLPDGFLESPEYHKYMQTGDDAAREAMDNLFWEGQRKMRVGPHEELLGKPNYDAIAAQTDELGVIHPGRNYEEMLDTAYDDFWDYHDSMIDNLANDYDHAAHSSVKPQFNPTRFEGVKDRFVTDEFGNNLWADD